MAMPSRIALCPTPLTRPAFAPFGDVIDIEGSRPYMINDGYAERYDDLARIDVTEAGGRPLLNIFRAKPRALPLRIRMVERHPLSSQAFLPLRPKPFLVVVAAPGRTPAAGDLRAFITCGQQGVNYARGTWHHPLIAFGEAGDFLVIDRSGVGENCEEVLFDDVEILLESPPA
ncbi:MAG: ureidoglycolate lyase [Rhodospirillales bacterium]|nr:ureidoglycolate lyase [Rhodospirillales bacterium]